MLKPADLSSELAKGTIRPAYLVAGAEPLLRDDAVAAIRAAVLTGAASDWNLDRLAGESTSPGALQDAVRALPVMAPHRLVLLVEPERRRGAGAKALTDAVADVVGEVAAQQGTVLVVVAEKADRRARWVKAFADPATIVDCEPPRAGRALVAFIKAEARLQGIAFEEAAAGLLAERIGPQLMLLRQEIAKCGLLAGEGVSVTSAHVADSTSSVAEQPIWDLTDAIGERQLGRAIQILARLQASGAAAPMLLGVLAGHFRKLALVKEGRAVAGPPFVVRKLESQSNRFTRRGLRDGLDRIHAADTALKGMGTLSPEMTLEDLVIELTA
jgi:DNA polymerase-3 subunit delta